MFKLCVVTGLSLPFIFFKQRLLTIQHLYFVIEVMVTRLHYPESMLALILVANTRVENVFSRDQGSRDLSHDSHNVCINIAEG